MISFSERGPGLLLQHSFWRLCRVRSGSGSHCLHPARDAGLQAGRCTCDPVLYSLQGSVPQVRGAAAHSPGGQLSPPVCCRYRGCLSFAIKPIWGHDSYGEGRSLIILRKKEGINPLNGDDFLKTWESGGTCYKILRYLSVS